MTETATSHLGSAIEDHRDHPQNPIDTKLITLIPSQLQSNQGLDPTNI